MLIIVILFYACTIDIIDRKSNSFCGSRFQEVPMEYWILLFDLWTRRLTLNEWYNRIDLTFLPQKNR